MSEIPFSSANNKFPMTLKRLPSNFAETVIELEILADEKYKDDLKIETV